MFRKLALAATALTLVTTTLVTTAPVVADTPEAAAARLEDFLARIPDLGPGYAVVVVTEDDVILNHVQGDRRASTGAPLTTDTPIYIASQTKAFVGLLAAALDERGILALDSTIADHWPNIQFPEGVDPATYTLRDLITHDVPISVDIITTLEAYVTEVNHADYPALIAEFGEAREAGFQYDNLGYNIYGAILHSTTGKSWQDWLDEVIFDPLGMDHTSARTSDFSNDELAWSHIWQGEELGWHDVRPKTDAMMQSAGGLVISTHDMATWMQLQLRGEGPDGSGLTASMLTTAQTPYAQTHSEDRRNALELPCTGYSLGWNVCDFEGSTLHGHGGGYTGNRTMMAFVPELGVGIGVFSNSDNMTGWLTSRTVIMYLQYLTEHADAETWSTRRPEIYPQRVERYLGYRQQRQDESRNEERWGDWSWSPSAADLAEFEGRWRTGNPYLDVLVAVEGEALVARWGDYVVNLEPAQTDLFGGQRHPFDPWEDFGFARDDSGAITSMTWGEDTYTRVD